MRKGVIRWFDLIKRHGSLFDIANMKEVLLPEKAFNQLGVEMLPKNQKVLFETEEQNGVTIVSKCVLVED